jgi:phage FluMu gp28-like protein
MTKIQKENLPSTLGTIHPKSTYILGVDFARKGKDETAIVILEKPFTSDDIFICYMETLHTPDLMMAVARVSHLDRMFSFKRIYVDETGLGAGPTDMLKNELGGKIEGVTFTRGTKAEMFTNLKLLMSRKKAKLHLPDYKQEPNHVAKKLFYQFLTIKQEFTEGSEIPKIFHESNKHDDLVCALALASMYFNIRQVRRGGYYGTGVSR